MDDTDRRILQVIQAHPEITMRDLGEAVGLSHTPCWKRLQALEAAGILIGRRYVLDREALGFGVTGFCLVKLRAHSDDGLKRFETAVQQTPEIIRCAILSGDDDYLLEIVAQSLRDYERIVNERIVKLPGVESISSRMSLRDVKPDSPLPV